MRVVSAYLLAVLGGNSSPSKDDITSILGSVGIEAEGDKIDLLLKEMEGKDVNEVISEGVGKMASVSMGGGGGGGGGSGGGAAAGGGGDTAPAEEEKKEEEEEEEDDDMGFSLFD